LAKKPSEIVKNQKGIQAMDYFLMKQSGTISIPKAAMPEVPSSQEPSVRITEDLPSMSKYDYIASEQLLSDRLKQLLEQYLPEQPWQPCVFIDPKKKEQITFWFLPDLPYVPRQVIMASNGLPAAVFIDEQDFAKKSPGIFRIRSPKGTVFLIVHLSVAESILRRGICGLELERLKDLAVS